MKGDLDLLTERGYFELPGFICFHEALESLFRLTLLKNINLELSVKTVQESENALSQLSEKELAEFRRWYEDFDGKQWDLELEKDIHSGKLDSMAGRTIQDFGGT